jgi:hypothetical protein
MALPDDYDPNPPALKQVWQEAPHIPGEEVKTPSDGGGGGDGPPPTHRAYEVSPGSIRDTENTLLRVTREQVAHYEDFKTYVNDRKEWIFSFYDSDSRYTGVPGFRGGSVIKDHPLNPETAEKSRIAMDQGLLAVANVIELVGLYIGMLNNSAQGYAEADIASTMPEADTGPNGGNGSSST